MPGHVDLGEPRTKEKTASSTTGASAALPDGVPENCRDSYFGTDETRSLNSSSTRSFEREAVAGGRQLRWRLIQYPSSSEAKRTVETYRTNGEKCELISLIDLEVQDGYGQAVQQTDGSYTDSSATITVDDVVLTVIFSEFAQDEAKEAVKKMATGMETRLKANRSK